MGKETVAVIGAGPSGLSMLKQLREDGFSATVFERRDKVGGLWAYSENGAYTTALPRTTANISKFTCGFSDYPIDDKYPTFMNPVHFQQFMEEYAHHFDLMEDIVLNATVKLVSRDDDRKKWIVRVEFLGKTDVLEFDKVVFCHGYQTVANVPVFGGEDKFEGIIMHAQQYRRPEEFEGKNVAVLGLTSTSGDIIPDLMPHAAKVWIAHRRGSFPFKRYRNGTPADLMISWRRRMISHFLQRHFPLLAKYLADWALTYLGRHAFGRLDPAWRLEPFPSIALNLPGSWEPAMPFLQDGSLTSMHGIRRYVGPRSVEFADGTVLDDVDAVIYCTGYRADFSVAPFLETSKPTARGYGGPPIYRLYMNIFPPAYWDSCALLCYNAFGKSNGFSFADVTSMAISNTWRGLQRLPPRREMEAHIDAHQAWIAQRWRMDPTTDTSAVKQWEFQAWLHGAAGTGTENLGWGWKGWKFWLKDRKLYGLMNHGVETAHMYRFFETGKRKAWPGARDAIIHMNELVRKTFPLRGEQLKETVIR